MEGEKNLEGKTQYVEEKERFEKVKVNDIMKEIIEKINDAIAKKKILIKNSKIGHSKWWDKDCTKRKREVRKALR